MPIKRTLLVSLIIFILLTACNQKTSPTQAAQPTQEPAQPVSPTAAPSGKEYVPINACDHPYYPHAEGSWWETSDGTIYAVIDSQGDNIKASATVSNTASDGKVTLLHYNCENGRLDLVATGDVDEAGNEINLRSIAESTGGKCESLTMLPSMVDIMNQQSWKQCEATCRVTTTLQLITQFGTFDAIRVDCDNGTAKYFAYGMGLVKNCTINGCLEVTAYTLPY